MDFELENRDRVLLADIGKQLLVSDSKSFKSNMSFRDQQSSDYRSLTSGARGSVRNGSADPNSNLDHATRVNEIRKEIEELQGDLLGLTRLVDIIGSKKEGPDQRHKLTATMERCAAAARSINHKLENLEGGPDRQKKQIKSKLTGDFMKLRNDFQSVSGLAKQKLAQAARAAKAAAASSSSSSASTRSSNSEAEDEQRLLLGDRDQAIRGSEAEQDRLQQQIRQEELSFNAAMIQERQQQFQTMERDIAQIEEIFKDLSMLVSEQGIQIDNIEQNIVNSRDHVQSANEEINKAAEYQRAARAKMCWCALFFAVIALVLVIILTR